MSDKLTSDRMRSAGKTAFLIIACLFLAVFVIAALANQGTP